MTHLEREGARSKRLLIGRQVLLHVIGFGGGVALARILGPRDFGIWAVGGFVLNTAAALLHLGLAAGLIQRAAPSQRDIGTAYTLQAGFGALTIAVGALAVLVAWMIGGGVPTVVAISAAVVGAVGLSALRPVPAALLERDLRFGAIAAVDLVATGAFYAVGIGLALRGAGVWSFALGAVTQRFVDTAGLFLAHGSVPFFRYHRATAKRLLRFGTGLQTRTIADTVAGAALPIAVGALFGPEVLGYAAWAQANAVKPMFLALQISRVGWPMIARAESEQEGRRQSADLASDLVAGVGPLFAIGFALAVPGTVLIYSAKWLPGVPLMWWLIAAQFVAVIAVAFEVPHLAGLRSGPPLRASMAGAVVLWVGTLAAAPFVGAIAYGIGSLVLALAKLGVLAGSLNRAERHAIARNAARGLVLTIVTGAAAASGLWFATPLQATAMGTVAATAVLTAVLRLPHFAAERRRLLLLLHA